jgi:acetolactate synthase-1/2/3 large subunit
MLVMDVIAEILKREGISTLFCFPTTPIIEAAAAVGIKPVICRQERVGVHMADGFARVSNGRPPGVFAMQYGPGAENAFAGVATAFSDSSPVVFLPLGHPRETAQLFPMFKSSRSYAAITKSVEEVILPEQIVNVMRRAFAQVKNGRQGPVMVEVPADVHSTEVSVDPSEYRQVPVTRSAGDERDIDEAARMLLDASCPMILAGQGVFYGEATEELRRFAELLQAPVMTTFDGKSAFPEDHPLALGPGGGTFTGHGRHILHKSDLVLGIGCSFTKHGIATPALPSGKKIIHATNDTRDLHKAFAADLGILGDAKLVLGQLIEAVGDRLNGKARPDAVAREVAGKREEWLARWQGKLRSDERPINPYRVISEFMRVVKPGRGDRHA